MTETASAMKAAEKIGRVEAQIGRVEGQISSLVAQFESLGDTVRGLAKQVSLRGQTNWSVVFAGASVVLLVFFAWQSGYVRDQERIDATQSKLLEAVIDHVSDGHPGSVEDQVSALRGEFERFIDQDASGHLAITARQRDYAASVATLRANVAELMRRMGEAEDRAEKHDTEVADTNGRQWEAITAIERETFGCGPEGPANERNERR